MKTEVFLVRHGETEWNVLGKYQGCKDTELSERGRIQAGYLKEKFQGGFDYIFTSPLKRAFETAQIIAQDKEVKPVHDIREINFGDWEGLTIKEIATKFPKEFNLWRSDKLEAPICGGDLSLKNASIRAKNAVIEIIKAHEGKKIVIVAHGGIIKAAIIGLMEWDMNMYHKIVLGNTAVNVLEFDGEKSPLLVKLNDTSHLPKNYDIKSLV